MTRPSALHRLDALQETRSLVVLLHGYGADGQDLLDLGRHWRDLLPHTAFLAPDAPAPCEINPSGYQWWSLAHALENGITEDMRHDGAQTMLEPLTQMLEEETARLGIGMQNVALVGFSQGTMLALHVGLRQKTAPACILGYSGMLIAPQLLAAEALAKPPIMLVHGMMDNVVPYSMLGAADAALAKAGFDVETMAVPNLGHGIDHTGLHRGGTFLHKHLYS